MNRANDLPPLARPLFPPEVVIVEGDPSVDADPLHPKEEEQIARAVLKRRREFAMGRQCARRALQSLGMNDVVLVNGEDRAPRWPEGTVGSITHTAGYCGAAVARVDNIRAVGIDAEPEEPLSERLWRRIATVQEQAIITGMPEGERGHRGRALFSAKECFYKCQYTLTRTYLGFQDAEVTFEGDTFVVTLLKETAVFSEGTKFPGRVLRSRGILLTAMHLDRRYIDQHARPDRTTEP
ncbi:MAG: 4'-phosphopantetheinyl transferase superfamily protein [Myxococcales bacterium]|nr:4'-phosphopantetheinyl transferase superfamily protein [Myxococcales bacterium]